MSRLTDIIETITPIYESEEVVESNYYKVKYIDSAVLRKNKLYLFGYTYRNSIFICHNLPKLVKRGVLRHEVYHTEDRHNWLGKYGREIRANIYVMFHDPVAFLTVFIYSLNCERIKTYCNLYIHPRNLHN